MNGGFNSAGNGDSHEPALTLPLQIDWNAVNRKKKKKIATLSAICNSYNAFKTAASIHNMKNLLYWRRLYGDISLIICDSCYENTLLIYTINKVNQVNFCQPIKWSIRVFLTLMKARVWFLNFCLTKFEWRRRPKESMDERSGEPEQKGWTWSSHSCRSIHFNEISIITAHYTTAISHHIFSHRLITFQTQWIALIPSSIIR